MRGDGLEVPATGAPSAGPEPTGSACARVTPPVPAGGVPAGAAPTGVHPESGLDAPGSTGVLAEARPDGSRTIPSQASFGADGWDPAAARGTVAPQPCGTSPARWRQQQYGTPPARWRQQPLVEVVVPVYNEQEALDGSIRRLHDYLTRRFPFGWRITIADNASTDTTPVVARRLAGEFDRVRVARLEAKGRGRALRAAWSSSDADVVAYMDVDLSSGLEAFLPLVAPLLSGHSDVAIGSRLVRGSRVVRGPKREIISRCYNSMLRVAFHTSFRDAQCGFKAVRADVARALLPAVENDHWFFDTELLLLAERNGLRIHEVPVDWTDDPDSRVDVVATAMEDIRGMIRVARRIIAGRAGVDLPPQVRAARLPRDMGRQLGTFAAIGVCSTLAYVVAYALLREGGASSFAANFIALLGTAVGNTWANRRLTFGQVGSEGALRQFAESGVVFVLGLAVSSAGLGLLHALWSSSGVLVEIVTVLLSGVLATVVRFVLMRAWVFHPARSPRPRDTSTGRHLHRG
ncbi:MULTISPECIES: glycosyltransferase [Protofrankia]|uniref:dolichyl-phosphate beta-glucosyltransferase n=1 Tax=Protofrankia coriariae TaxID=1562887 RepID=A0ABR5F6J2_9ACTN|nr:MULTISPECIES: glycosyltransferase [Protofrankia]KLL12312.1 glycosyl transferase [Protofrankia coriariae]ONH37738.1 glycosyl transferase [Protofrankia sp. BMG5.30]